MISQISLAETYSVMPAVINAIINKSEQICQIFLMP